MKQFAILLFVTLFTLSAYSQVKITNDTEEPITVAIAYYVNTRSYSGLVSRGWWNIIPGETITVGSFLKDGDNTYYIHAHSTDNEKKWGTEVYLAVNETYAFEIENCDKAYVLDGDNITKVGFSKQFVHIGLLDLYTDSISISE